MFTSVFYRIFRYTPDFVGFLRFEQWNDKVKRNRSHKTKTDCMWLCDKLCALIVWLCANAAPACQNNKTYNNNNNNENSTHSREYICQMWDIRMVARRGRCIFNELWFSFASFRFVFIFEFKRRNLYKKMKSSTSTKANPLKFAY